MARMPRPGVTDGPHMIWQRVQEGQALFRDEEDAVLLLSALKDAAREAGVSVHAYALAPDHFYLLATPGSEGGLGRMMQAVGRRYVAAYNRRHGRQGGLWAARFKSAPVEPARHLLDCMVFIETESVRTGRTLRPSDDRWTSTAHHLGLRTDPLIQDHRLFWTLGNTPFEREAAWGRRLEEGLPPPLYERIANACRTGWALGEGEWIAKVEASTGARLRPRPRGRPPKAAEPAGHTSLSVLPD